jgi:glycosyl hydrolase family 12
MRFIQGRAIAALATVITASGVLAATAQAGVIPASVSNSKGTEISGAQGKECSSTSPQYMINAGGTTLRLQPTHARFTVLKSQNYVWQDPYVTDGYNNSVNSVTCDGHEIPGSKGKYAKSFALPVPADSDGYPTASAHYSTPNGFSGDSGLDLWYSLSTHAVTSNEMQNGGSGSTEIMIWTSHPDLEVQTSNLKYYRTKVDGHWWRVTYGLAAYGHGAWGSHPHGWNVVNFIAPRYTDGQFTVKALHINKFVSYAQDHGMMNRHDYLMAIDSGFEISYGGKGAAMLGYLLTGEK